MVEGDKKATIDKAVGMIKQAKGADLMILPEIWNLGFMEFDRYVPEAEHEDGPTLTALRDMARETGAFIHTGSIVAEYDGKYYNSSYLLSPKGEILANYRKIHLFGYGSRETEILSSGSEIVVLDTDLGRLAMATCYDLRFPELFRRMMDMGAKMILVCSAWPYPRLEHWIMINRVRAIENQCFLVSCNMTGAGHGIYRRRAFHARGPLGDHPGQRRGRGGHRPLRVRPEPGGGSPGTLPGPGRPQGLAEVDYSA